MTLKRNIIASYASQIYVTAVGILTVPLYIQYMGAEAYGLVGFFAMLQAWFNLLDMGLTPTIARESARFNGGVISLLEYRRLARALEGVFALVALLGCAILFAMAQPIATQWLNASELPLFELTHALQIMAIIVALRWMCGLYRGVITGAERLVWLSGFNSLIATARYILALPLVMFVSKAPQVYFLFQLCIALFELIGFMWMAYRLLPPLPENKNIEWQWAPIKPVLKFAMAVGVTTSIWALVTQTDRLILSKILSLTDYGYFTVAVMLASGIMLITSPISSTITPRMVRLQAEGRNDNLIVVYRQTTQLITLIAIPVALVFIFFSRQVLWIWTGNRALMDNTSPVLALYAFGYLILSLNGIPYILQYAKGDVKMHLIGNLLFAIILMPSVIWAANMHGALGAGWAWATTNIVYFIFWIPIVHARIMPGFHIKWLLIDIFRLIVAPLCIVILAKLFIVWSEEDRLMMTAKLMTVIGLMTAISFIRLKKKLNYGSVL